MSQISLSHQFSRRWSVAPKQVKDALVQELDDIVRLLDNSTTLEDFKFAIPDLDDYIETVYHDLSQQKALESTVANAIDSKAAVTPDTTNNLHHQVDEPAVSEQDKPKGFVAQNVTLGNDTDVSATSSDTPDNTRTDTSNTLNTSTSNTLNTSTSNTNVNTTLAPNTPDNNTTDTITTESEDPKGAALATMGSKTVSSSVIIQSLDANNNYNNKKEAILSEQTVDTLKTLSKQQTKESSQSSTDAPHRAIDDTLLKELEANIDDYLTERLTDISEDLKSWLREQVKQHNQQVADDQK